MRKYVFFGSDIFRQSVYGTGHPLNIARVWPVIDICRAQGWLDDDSYQEVLPASPALLSQYHDPDYVEALLDAERDQSLPEEMRTRFNIGQSSNPIFPEIYKRPATAAHASILAADMLASGQATHLFNPSGGTHHGRRAMAYGFCFVNDPAIAIARLREKTSKPITYLDIDAHHCDGVQDWHADTPNLQLISLHQQDIWPRTGNADDTGGGNAINYPLAKQATDRQFLSLMQTEILPKIKAFSPSYIIIQAGADGHRHDPQSKLNYSLDGYWQAVRLALSLDIPSLVLGGGGYNPYITAKAWAGLWALIIGKNPSHETLCEEAKSVLRGLTWHHRLGRDKPAHWTEEFGDRL